jgi:hypothetical protein
MICDGAALLTPHLFFPTHELESRLVTTPSVRGTNKPLTEGLVDLSLNLVSRALQSTHVRLAPNTNIMGDNNH